jgi:hypothetical protein
MLFFIKNQKIVHLFYLFIVKNFYFQFFYSHTAVFVDRNVSVPAPSCSPCLAKFLVNDTDKAVLDYKNTDWPTQLSPSSAIQQGFSVPKFSHHQAPPKPHLPNHFAAQNSPPHSFETRSKAGGSCLPASATIYVRHVASK